MADIFVSYATEDHERVRPLVEALEANGFEVWWARNILGGEDFSAEIERQIHVASAVIVAWSKRAVASHGYVTKLSFPATPTSSCLYVSMPSRHRSDFGNFKSSIPNAGAANRARLL